MKDDILIGDTPKARKRRHRLKQVVTQGRLWKHSALDEVIGLVNEEQIASYCCFTLVRNPWDRMLSYYTWLQDQSFDHPAVALSKTLSFSAFIRDMQTVSSFRTWHYGAYVQRDPVQEYPCSFIRLEHFTEDFAAVSAKIGIKITLPHENASQRGRDWRPHYSDDDAAFLAQLCQPDIARFSYQFDPQRS